MTFTVNLQDAMLDAGVGTGTPGQGRTRRGGPCQPGPHAGPGSQGQAAAVCRRTGFWKHRRCGAKAALMIIWKYSNKLPGRPRSEWGAEKGERSPSQGLVWGQECQESDRGSGKKGRDKIS